MSSLLGERALQKDTFGLGFLHLGIQFKRDITTCTMWTLIGKNLPLSLIRHLNELAFIAEVGKEYCCVVFADGKASLSDEELAQREKITAKPSFRHYRGRTLRKLHDSK